VARSPLLRKGGPHERAASGKRHRARVSTHEAIEEWLENRQEEETRETRESDNGEQQLPVFYLMAGTCPTIEVLGVIPNVLNSVALLTKSISTFSSL
jgi:hypothetical protein